ncbi:uncharacterized protein LOC135194517 [Vanessa tameamea]|uniref:Uncharacterized protein LOC135194517 n=1 Tax=Vanessa tameamea TaxID=334116 RepID=A0ABM4AXX3_VANTA
MLSKANSFSLDEFEYNIESQIFSLNNSRISKHDKELDDQISKNNKIISDRDDTENVNYMKVDNLAISDRIKENLTIDHSSNDSSEISDLTESQAEIVTFKVLEELNKVKNYLNRKLTKCDSGYRSFQPRSSGGSASQCSSLWINESAHCLMSFLTTCPLVMSTSEISDDISKVLGKLIDKLHEDEIYPKFLEEILNICNDLLNTIYEGPNYGENILNKDEIVQRFLFLNRSLHIIKYSIEKITTILEKTLDNLNDSFEIQHTDKSENICYIFYILEDLLKRNNRYKNLLSQNSSQTSQDEKRILKKSSLTEIWRKKWNLTKTDICEGALEKKCSLTKCSDVLNKIIVQAMEGYSLISFAALQCFNLLQN